MNYDRITFHEEVNITFMKIRLIFFVDIQSFFKYYYEYVPHYFCNNSAESLANLKLPKANIIFLP